MRRTQPLAIIHLCLTSLFLSVGDTHAQSIIWEDPAEYGPDFSNPSDTLYTEGSKFLRVGDVYELEWTVKNDSIESVWVAGKLRDKSDGIQDWDPSLGPQSIFRFYNGEWKLIYDLPERAYRVHQIAMASMNKGWIITSGSGSVFEFDGVFWNEVDDYLDAFGGSYESRVSGKKGSTTYHIYETYPISVISEEEAWFANGVRYKDGVYERKVEWGSNLYNVRTNSAGHVAFISEDSLHVYYDDTQIGIKTDYWNHGVNYYHDFAITEETVLVKAPGGLLRWEYKKGGSHVEIMETDVRDFQYIKNGPLAVTLHGAMGYNWDENAYEDWDNKSFEYENVSRTEQHPSLDLYSNQNVNHLLLDSGKRSPPILLPLKIEFARKDGDLVSLIVRNKTFSPSNSSASSYTTSYAPQLLWGRIVYPFLIIPESFFIQGENSILPKQGEVVIDTFFVTNTGKGLLDLYEIDINHSDFRFQTLTKTTKGYSFDMVDSMKTFLGQNDSLGIAVAFIPSKEGIQTTDLTIQTNDPNNPITTIQLTGATSSSVSPAVSMSSEIDFGQVVVDLERSRSILVKNTGFGTLELSVQNPEGAAFIVPQNQYAIGTGDSLLIDFQFNPKDIASYEVEFNIETNDPKNQTVPLVVRGIGISPPPPLFEEGTVSFNTTPSTPNTVEATALKIYGTMPYENVQASVISQNIAGNEIVVNIGSAWSEGRKVEGSSNWQTTIDLGFLETGNYTVTVYQDDAVLLNETLRIAVGQLPPGPVTIDFDPRPDDQNQTRVGGIAPGDTIRVDLYINDIPEVKGWNTKIDYDDRFVEYLSGSFTDGTFLPEIISLVEDGSGYVDVGGTILSTNSTAEGSGYLGTLKLRATDEFADSTQINVSSVGLHLADGTLTSQNVNFTAIISSERTVPALVGDFDRNGKVNFADFFVFAEKFGTNDSLCDLDQSGKVDFVDFFIFAEQFGKEASQKLIALAAQHIGLPSQASLNELYPNPFNHEILIRYSISIEGDTQLRIFNLAGQEIRQLHSGYSRAGTYTSVWDGRDTQGVSVGNGVYIVELRSEQTKVAKKIMLLK